MNSNEKGEPGIGPSPVTSLPIVEEELHASKREVVTARVTIRTVSDNICSTRVEVEDERGKSMSSADTTDRR